LSVGTLFGTSNSSFVLGLGGSDIKIPLFDRVFIDPLSMGGIYTEYGAYALGNPDFPGERAGSNDSSKDNFFEGKSNYLRGDVRFWYLLPIGHGRASVLRRISFAT
jgi:hypothetical protein